MRLLHVMLRVRDLEKSIAFYTELFGMKVFRRKDYPNGRFTLAFLGYDDESKETALELTHNWDTDDYELGTAYGHLAIGVPDVYKACEEIEKKGGLITRAPGPMKHSDTVLAFVEDPDGYKIELLAR
jgi:lactoylglutathione lyase